MNVLICVPTFESIDPETFKSIYNQNTEHKLAFDYVRGYDCANARNKIALKAKDYDYILMVDSDIILPSDAVELLTQDSPDFVTGLYPCKRSEREAELFKFSEIDFKDRYSFEELGQIKTDRLEVKGCGMGCALIKSELFFKLPAPWFQYVQYDNFDVLSEDLFFCELMRLNGVDILADLRVRCGHIIKKAL